LFFFNGTVAIPITSTDAITPIGIPNRQNMLTAISAIVCSGKTVIAGTQHGLYVRDSLAKWNEVPVLAQYSVAVLVQGSGGTVWIGTNRGLFSWNNADTVKAIPADSSMDGSITSLAFTHGDSLLVGTVNGLFVYFDSLWSKPKQDALGPWISALAVDNDNVLLIGTNEGVFRMRNSEIDLLR
jgi:ligand-binding sensor domain-containing protein